MRARLAPALALAGLLLASLLALPTPAAAAVSCDYERVTPEGTGAALTDDAMLHDASLVAFTSSADLTGENGDGNTEVFLYDAVADEVAQLTDTTVVANVGARLADGGDLVFYERRTGDASPPQPQIRVADLVAETDTEVATGTPYGGLLAAAHDAPVALYFTATTYEGSGTDPDPLLARYVQGTGVEEIDASWSDVFPESGAIGDDGSTSAVRAWDPSSGELGHWILHVFDEAGEVDQVERSEGHAFVGAEPRLLYSDGVRFTFAEDLPVWSSRVLEQSPPDAEPTTISPQVEGEGDLLVAAAAGGTELVARHDVSPGGDEPLVRLTVATGRRVPLTGVLDGEVTQPWWPGRVLTDADASTIAFRDDGLVLGECGRFADVPPSHPFAEEIGWAFAQGISEGYADATFRPSADVSRQAMVAFLHRLAGSPAVSTGAPSFSDAPASHPFFEQIEWAAAEGITTGYADGTFRPGADVSRQAMAAFLRRSQGDPEPTLAGAPTFPDVGPASAFFEDVEWLAEEGISTGYPDGTFRPGASVTRQAMAAFLQRTAALGS